MIHAVALILLAASPGAAPRRCNTHLATQLEDRVREYDRRPPGAKDFNDRFVELQLLISSADQEIGILQSVCSEPDAVPIVAQLNGVQAWALLLESDLNRQNYAKRCPDAEVAVSRAFVGNAWVILSKSDPQATGRFPTVKTVVPKAQARAAALGMTLPAPADATAFWLGQLQHTASEAQNHCPQ